MPQNRPKGLFTFLILQMMKEKKRYGYEILEKIGKMSGGHWDPSYGTVYGALERMEERDLIERTGGSGEGRKYFKITEKGKDILKKDPELKEELQNKIRSNALGFLNIYCKIFGEDELRNLKKDIEKRLDHTLE
ncbi:MAG: PadR family transcriptional regulator [Candidatus Hadarchaeia archaeon]